MKTFLCVVVLSGFMAGMAWAVAPRGPRDLVAIDPASDQGTIIKLSFKRSYDDGGGAGNVTGYKIYQRRSGQPFSLFKTVTATGAASYLTSASGLTKDIPHAFGVAATNGTEDSAMATVSATPRDTSKPRPPTSFRTADPAGDSGDTLNLIIAKSPDDGTGTKDVIRYKIGRRLATEVNFTPLTTIPATGARSYVYRATGLTRGTAYVFNVVASDGTNDSTALTANGTPRDTRVPRPARNPVAADVAGDQGDKLRLTFDKSLDDGAGANDVRSYSIWKRLAGQAFAQIGTVNATGIASYSFTVTGLTRGVRYGLGVKCTDGANTSTIVAVWQTPVDNLAPGAVTNLVATDRPGDDGTAVNITFNRSADDGTGANDVQLYRIFRKIGAADWEQVGTINATDATSYGRTVDGLNTSGTCHVGITADDGVQQSSRVSIAVTPRDNTPPAPPSGLTVADYPNDTGTSLLVSFSPSPDDVVGDREVQRYRLYRTRTAGSLGNALDTVSATAAASYTYRDQTVTLGSTYYYSVRAEAATGNSVVVGQASGTPLDDRPVAAPSGLTAVDHPYDSGGVVDLRWSKSADDGGGLNHVNRYFIFRRMANVQTPPTQIATVNATGATTYSYADSAVPMDLILYEYTVTAVSVGDAQSTPAGPVRASAEDNNVLVFDPPTNLSARDLPADAGGQILLTWYRSPSENDVGPPPPPPLSTMGGYGGQYEFYRRTASGSYGTTPTFTVAADGTNDPMSYTDRGLTNGTRYYYKVRYRRYNQISGFTAEASAVPAVGSGSGAVAPASSAGLADDEGRGAGLQVRLTALPPSIVAGRDLEIGLAVQGTGVSAVYLEWGPEGATTQRSAGFTGSDSYETTMRLKTALLPRGTVILLRAVAATGGMTAASEAVRLTVQ